jgi:hypothetical protein
VCAGSGGVVTANKHAADAVVEVFSQRGGGPPQRANGCIPLLSSSSCCVYLNVRSEESVSRPWWCYLKLFLMG